jgi:glycosyltransferase involved in cell wall biosynthesis
MRILIVLTYYRPYISGLTLYAERLARALHGRGHHVTVLTSQYEKELSLNETIDGIRVIRLPIAFSLNKGVFMPSFFYRAIIESRKADVVHLFLPQFEAPFAALAGKVFRTPVVTTYVCDLLLPPGLLNRAANTVINIMNHLTARLSDRVVTLTQDYGDASPFLKGYTDKLSFILPPIEIGHTSDDFKELFRQKYDLSNDCLIIGMAARLAAEKGVEVLLDAMPKILERCAGARVLFAGPYQNVRGEGRYAKMIMAKILPLQEKGIWLFLGPLSDEQLGTFYQSIHVLIVPSLNSTESYGMVQIESMINGTPVIASDLPGIRQPVLMSGQGRLIPVGDSDALADVICDVAAAPHKYRRRGENMADLHHPDFIAMQYESLFICLVQKTAPDVD